MLSSSSASSDSQLVLLELTVELCLFEDLRLFALVLDSGLVPVLKHVLVELSVIATALVTALTTGAPTSRSTESSPSSATATTTEGVVALGLATILRGISASEVIVASASLEATLLTIAKASH